MTLPTAHGIAEALRAKFGELRQAWRAMTATERWITAFLASMIVGGVVTLKMAH